MRNTSHSQATKMNKILIFLGALLISMNSFAGLRKVELLHVTNAKFKLCEPMRPDCKDYLNIEGKIHYYEFVSGTSSISKRLEKIRSDSIVVNGNDLTIHQIPQTEATTLLGYIVHKKVSLGLMGPQILPVLMIVSGKAPR